MIRCANCGASVSDDSVFCFVCGKETGKNAGLSSAESIALAKDLAQKYDSRDLLMAQISNCETAIARNKACITGARYSTFRFFWPSLLVAQGVVVVVAFMLGIFAGATGNEKLVDYAKYICLLAEAVTLLIGYFIACGRRDRANGKIYREEDNVRSECKKIENELDGYKTELNKLNKDLKEYDRLIPATMRRKEIMAKVIGILESGEASDFNQAISLCSRR